MGCGIWWAAGWGAACRKWVPASPSLGPFLAAEAEMLKTLKWTVSCFSHSGFSVFLSVCKFQNQKTKQLKKNPTQILTSFCLSWRLSLEVGKRVIKLKLRETTFITCKSQ